MCLSIIAQKLAPTSTWLSFQNVSCIPEPWTSLALYHRSRRVAVFALACEILETTSSCAAMVIICTSNTEGNDDGF
jgi:hypothetical protein